MLTVLFVVVVCNCCKTIAKRCEDFVSVASDFKSKKLGTLYMYVLLGSDKRAVFIADIAHQVYSPISYIS